MYHLKALFLISYWAQNILGTDPTWKTQGLKLGCWIEIKLLLDMWAYSDTISRRTR